MSRNPYSEQDIRIIETLIKAGYGWRSFANSVKKQGWITQKQSDTLCNMANDLSAQYSKATRPNYSNRNRSNSGDHRDGDNFEWSDYGGVGEYF